MIERLEQIAKDIANSRVRLSHPLMGKQTRQDVIDEAKRMESIEKNLLETISDLKEKTMEDIKCVAGCKHFTGGEIKHHEHCPYYPESMSKMYDDLKSEVENLRLANDMRNTLFLDKKN